MDRDTNYPDEYTTREGVTVKTINIRGIGHAPTKSVVEISEIPLKDSQIQSK